MGQGMTENLDPLPPIQPQLRRLGSGEDPNVIRRFTGIYYAIDYDAHIYTSQW